MAIKKWVDNLKTIACHLFLYNGIAFDTFNASGNIPECSI